MSATASGLNGGVVWSPRRAGWLIVVTHAVIVGVVPIVAIFGIPGVPPQGNPALAVAVALAVLALQLRHSFAIARGERARGWPLSLLALALLVYLPMPWWFGWYWVTMQACLMASVPMVLRGWPAALAIAAPVVGTNLAVVANLGVPGARPPAAVVAYTANYWTATLAICAAAMYGSARLVRLLGELRETRAELAALAVGRERLRVSRDLHDLLGQSLSAVSLKGDLALRLLGSDPPAARAEIQSLTGVARSALRGVRAVSHDEHAVSLRSETDGAAALLAAAGIDARIRLDLADLAPPLERVLAWTVREGVANALRHSHARSCSITAGRRDGGVFLEIVNDGAPAPTGQGSGLAGLRERARALAGSVTAGSTGDGRWRLLVEIPEGVA